MTCPGDSSKTELSFYNSLVERPRVALRFAITAIRHDPMDIDVSILQNTAMDLKFEKEEPPSKTLKRKAIIIGASSGIGAALARGFAKRGYSIGLAARRQELLEELSESLDVHTVIRRIDICNTDDAIVQFREIAAELGDIDVVVISSGIGHEKP